MPIYEYVCADCGHKLEAIQKMNDEPLSDCPECSETRLKKLVSAAGFRLKGSGWYETDFKSSGKKGEPGGKKDDADGSSGKNDANSGGPPGVPAGGAGECCPATE